uniref:Putative secreted protein n=1 Tax=Anopheles triannulatus TaxID=58253 RepID=A0A2M4B7Q0_9DIPT
MVAAVAAPAVATAPAQPILKLSIVNRLACFVFARPPREMAHSVCASPRVRSSSLPQGSTIREGVAHPAFHRTPCGYAN